MRGTSSTHARAVFGMGAAHAKLRTRGAVAMESEIQSRRATVGVRLTAAAVAAAVAAVGYRRHTALYGFLLLLLLVGVVSTLSG